jgi:hypothetical protein
MFLMRPPALIASEIVATGFVFRHGHSFNSRDQAHHVCDVVKVAAIGLRSSVALYSLYFLISGFSCRTTFNNERWISILPL